MSPASASRWQSAASACDQRRVQNAAAGSTVVSVKAGEQQLRGLTAELARILGHDGHAGLDRFGERDVVEADQGDFGLAPRSCSARRASTVIRFWLVKSAVGGSEERISSAVSA